MRTQMCSCILISARITAIHKGMEDDAAQMELQELDTAKTFENMIAARMKESEATAACCTRSIFANFNSQLQ